MRRVLLVLPLLLLCSSSNAGAVRPDPDFKITSLQVSKNKAVVSVTNLAGSCGVGKTVIVKLALSSATSSIKDYSLPLRIIPCPNSKEVVPVTFTLHHEHSMGSGSCDVCSSLQATVDPNNVVSEKNENNNAYWQNIY